MIPYEVLFFVSQNLQEKLNSKIEIESNYSISGGCIHNSHIINTNHGKFFLKYNNLNSYNNFFVELRSLNLLKNTNTINIPSPYLVYKTNNYSYLVLENIESKSKCKNFWEEFGIRLAKLHKNSSEKFGLDFDNYIGSLEQYNFRKENWTDFFITQRLEKQIKLAEKKGFIDSSIRKKFEKLYSKLENIFPKENPSLIHGDLWSGNFITNDKGESVIFDPAIYFGHREMELSFTKLFGGFDDRFYISYNEEFPIQEGFEKRVDIYNIYPLLVHLNLFGLSYLSQIVSVLKMF